MSDPDAAGGAGAEVRLRPVEESDLPVFLEQEHAPEAGRRSRFRPRPEAAFMAHWHTAILADPPRWCARWWPAARRRAT
ncbi:hypothetical protein [Spongiactinospora sp. TRM90649]|uniref:hypothetical protein n=1 Tax=Spongiactinospora sp. TRM90649 TaxID=3031114 RepID=UPI0023F838EC|nr:hypothetical protein [Spongiactinospora sp. TRM90649]MDF5759214.1 hypothetical protein [Spongiactinospora sp. TRM90649]